VSLHSSMRRKNSYDLTSTSTQRKPQHLNLPFHSSRAVERMAPFVVAAVFAVVEDISFSYADEKGGGGKKTLSPSLPRVLFAGVNEIHKSLSQGIQIRIGSFPFHGHRFFEGVRWLQGSFGCRTRLILALILRAQRLTTRKSLVGIAFLPPLPIYAVKALLGRRWEVSGGSVPWGRPASRRRRRSCAQMQSREVRIEALRDPRTRRKWSRTTRDSSTTFPHAFPGDKAPRDEGILMTELGRFMPQARQGVSRSLSRSRRREGEDATLALCSLDEG